MPAIKDPVMDAQVQGLNELLRECLVFTEGGRGEDQHLSPPLASICGSSLAPWLAITDAEPSSRPALDASAALLQINHSRGTRTPVTTPGTPQRALRSVYQRCRSRASAGSSSLEPSHCVS
ncbi:hypothetical protein AAFF_G00310060 [Aldrovandia affinis]|uniref:Uncharacterized protein n=1 Tax=Aldrovandia affinis TaxID=143900 RepID=A0AAD7SPB3_9TELE|nr:hypothetical protein AAFF_G00310060 [Aldrovandia affinis]